MTSGLPSEAMHAGGAVRFGVLSTAAINQHILAAAANSNAFQIAAVASRSQKMAEAYAHENGIQRAYGDYRQLLEDDQIEAVYISLPNALHIEWAIRALEAGKHVLCEKPLCRSPAEAREVFDAAEAADRVLMEAFMYRHHPQTALLAELVATEIGELRTLRASHGGTQSDTKDIRLRPELQGGAMMDVGCYCLNVVRLLAGEPSLAVGTQVVGPTGVDVRFAGMLTFAGDVLATIDCGFDLAPTAQVEVTGSRGTIRARDPFLLRSSFIELTKDDQPTRWVDVSAADSYQLECENMAAAIRGREAPLLGRAEAVGQAVALEALYRSAESGSLPVSIA